MFLALAIAAAIHVQSGDTLSGIAASQGVSLSALEAANPQIANPNLIYAGQSISLPGGSSISGDASDSGGGSPSVTHSTAGSSSSSSSGSGSYSAPSSGAGTSGGGLSSIPGVPSSFAACVAWHESGNGANQAYNGGVYGIITASGINVNGQGIGAQKAAFSKLYAQYGSKPWAGDGCA